MRYLFVFFSLLVFICQLNAQEKVEGFFEYFETIKPRSIGPAGMSGRITSIDVNPLDKDIMFAGAASGGVWRSKNGGIDWQPVFEKENTASIGAIAISDHNPNIIWVGTGEGNPRNSANYGSGIYRSLDGGDTWTLMGLEKTRAIHRIIVHPDNADIVYVGAFGSMWGPNSERGVYKTIDGGKNWKKILFVDDASGIADLVMDPSNPNKLIAATWTNDRDPWFFNSGGEGSGIWVTYDSGENWARRTAKDGLPKGNLGRIGLAIAASKPDIVYALVEAKENGLYKSVDGGKTFKLVSKKNIGNRPFYYAEIYVDPQNENRLFNIYTYLSRSEDGGRTFKTIADYGNDVHPDHHAFWIDPENPEFIIDGNDGGLNISRDGGDTWRFAENLPVGQFYHVNYDMNIPYNVGGGMQDNGSWVGPAYTWKSGGITKADWQEVRFGDGFDIMFKPNDNRYVYAASQGGSVALVDQETGASQYIKPVHPDGEFLRFNWNAAMAQSPHDDCTIFYGSQYVHKSTDCGQHWEIISSDLTTNDTSKQHQDISGGLTIDATQAENHTTILVIQQDPYDAKTIWVGTDDGNLQLTRDGGKSWENQADRLKGIAPQSWIGYIELSQVNPGEAFVAANDYRRNDFAPYLYHTKDYGKTWKRIDNDIKGHTMCIVQDPQQENHLWAGTDQGLFYSYNYGKNWHKYNQGFPTVPVRDLKIHPREQDLIVGTFGRSIWILDDLRPFREIAKTQADVLEQGFALFDAPDAYIANYKSYQGIRFVAQGNFKGQNRGSNGAFTYWIKPPADEKARTKKPSKKIKVQIIDSAGDTIRTFTSKPKQWGMNRVSWNLRRDGILYPSRRAPKPGADRNSGNRVIPGTYEVAISYADSVETTKIVVHPDPRLETLAGMYDVKANLQAKMDTAIVNITAAWDKLRAVREGVKLTKSLLVHADKSIKDTLTSQANDLIAGIDSLKAIVMDPPNQKGIQRNPSNLSAKMWGARSYINQVEGSSSQMAEVSLKVLEEGAANFIKAVEIFINYDFKDFRAQVESAKLPLFSEKLNE